MWKLFEHFAVGEFVGVLNKDEVLLEVCPYRRTSIDEYYITNKTKRQFSYWTKRANTFDDIILIKINMLIRILHIYTFLYSYFILTRSSYTKCRYASVRPFLYFRRSTSTSVLRPFVKSGLLIGREVQVEVKFWSKWYLGGSTVDGWKYRKGRTDAHPKIQKWRL